MHRAESSRRGGKRQRNANPPPPPDPTQLIDAHRDRLANIQEFQWHPMLWLDMECLDTYGWDQPVRHLLEKAGLTFFLRPPSPHIYRQATMEFLASVTLERMYASLPGIPPSMGVSFWMNGAYRYITLAEFNVAIGFHTQEEVQTTEYQQALCDKPNDWTFDTLWEAISGQAQLPKTMRGTSLNPQLRICHKLLTGTLHARKESQSKINFLDLFALYCMHAETRCNPGALFIRAFKDFGTRAGGSVIVAPLISPLAERWGCPGREDIPPHLSPEYIREPLLFRMRLLFRMGSSYVVQHTIMDDIDYDPSSQSWDQQQSQSQSQSQQQHPDLSEILRRMEEDRALHHQLHAMMGNLNVRMDELTRSQEEFQRRMLRRFPSPAHSSSSSSEPES